MADQFNAYHRWLGVPPEEQPPHHYRLLGLALFESDLDVIRDGAERQMAHVRRYALGQHVELSQRILNELGAAKACLTDPAKKAQYDASLRSMFEQATVAPLPQPAEPPVLPPARPVVVTPTIVFSQQQLVGPRRSPWPLGGIAIGVVVVGVGVAAWLALLTQESKQIPLRLNPLAPRTLELGESLLVRLRLADPEQWNGKVRYDLGRGSPAGVTIDPQSGEASWKPNKVGRHEIKFHVLAVADERQQDETVLVVEVQESAAKASRPPRLATLPSQTVVEGTDLRVRVPITDQGAGGDGRSDESSEGSKPNAMTEDVKPADVAPDRVSPRKPGGAESQENPHPSPLPETERPKPPVAVQGPSPNSVTEMPAGKTDEGTKKSFPQQAAVPEADLWLAIARIAATADSDEAKAAGLQEALGDRSVEISLPIFKINYDAKSQQAIADIALPPVARDLDRASVRNRAILLLTKKAAASVPHEAKLVLTGKACFKVGHCPACNGTGWVDCPDCHRGITTETIDKPVLMGNPPRIKGTIKEAIKVTCRRCAGRGTLRCAECGRQKTDESFASWDLLKLRNARWVAPYNAVIYLSESAGTHRCYFFLEDMTVALKMGEKSIPLTKRRLASLSLDP